MRTWVTERHILLCYYLIRGLYLYRSLPVLHQEVKSLVITRVTKTNQIHNSMNKLVTIILTLITVSVFGQTDLTEEAQPIVAEGKLLYKSEMASWYGTDLFLENYKKRDNIGGYLSYTENAVSKCVFFSRTANPKVIGTIAFDSTYSTKTARVDLAEREFTTQENDLYVIRKIALSEVNSDTLFKRYNGTSLNLIPLIDGNVKKVYVLTGPQQPGVVIFGNDYLLTFDQSNKLVLKKRIHKNIIVMNYAGKEAEGADESVHNHLPETGDFITATDICTLMLYKKSVKWKTHNVISERFLNIWNCETDQLTVLSREAVDEISKGRGKLNQN